MNVLERYVLVAVLRGVVVILAVLLAISTFVDFVAQLDDVGTGDYGLAGALTYVGLGIPGTLVDMLPAAALLGALLSLGNLAVHSELVVMRASGISHYQLLRAAGLAGFVLMVVMILLGESVAPTLGAYAREFRTEALHEDVDLADGQSAWLKDGSWIFSLRQGPAQPGLGSVLLFDVGDNQTLRRIARADSADVDAESRWVLSNYAETEFLPERIDVDHERVVRESYNLSPDLLGLSVVREDLLDTPELERYIRYLQENDLDATRYLIAYWARMSNVVSVLLMTVLAVPFVFGSLRSAGTGARLLVGMLIGLAYYVATQMLANSGEVFSLDPKIVAWAPSAVLSLVTAAALARVR
jgi:lipopolysaccharide export system permease protein